MPDLRPSTFDLRLSTFDLRPSTFSFRLSTFDLRLSTSNFRLSTFDFRLVAVFLVMTTRAFAQMPAPQTGPAANQLPPALRGIGIDQKLDSQVPFDLVFRDEHGQAVRLGKYFGTKPVILSLVYYQCPMLCSQVLNGLASSLGVLSFDVGNQFEVITVSFDSRDTPESAAAKKESYLRRYKRPGAASGWHFLTGDEHSIQTLTHSVGFRYAFNSSSGQFAHASGIMVLTPQGRVARYFYGIDYAPRDLRLALVEASRNRIGSAVDQILLFCYHYDPSTGKYSALVLNMVKLGAGLMLLVLGLMFFFLRKERPEAPA
ncbi:MAG TPA: SCO family protein [Acidobacteriota bacterium]|nr:SCO family protein [Acidobacteriota bacterium]